MDGLFDNRVSPATERLACPILIGTEISLDLVTAYDDVVKHIPGMAQSEGAFVVRELVVRRKPSRNEPRPLSVRGRTATQDKSRVRHSNFSTMHCHIIIDASPKSMTASNPISSAPNESLTSTGIPQP